MIIIIIIFLFLLSPPWKVRGALNGGGEEENI